MSALEDSAAAAAGVEDEDADDDEQQPSGAAVGGAAAAAPKKGRATQLEMAERAVIKYSAELAEAEGMVASVAPTKSDKGKAARAANKIGDLRSKLETAKKTLEEKKAAAATAALKAEAAAAEKKAKKEISEPTTEAFLLYFIESVLAAQSKFGRVGRVVWEHVHYNAAKKIEAGDFAQSDLRSVEAYTKIYARYWGEFKLWCAKATRAINLSGVPAEEVEEKVKDHFNVTTRLFLKFHTGMRPMAQPEWQVAGDSAGQGGMGAVELGAGPVPDDTPPPAPWDANLFGAAPTVFGAMGGGGDDGDDDSDDDDDDASDDDGGAAAAPAAASQRTTPAAPPAATPRCATSSDATSTTRTPGVTPPPPSSSLLPPPSFCLPPPSLHPLPHPLIPPPLQVLREVLRHLPRHLPHRPPSTSAGRRRWVVE